MFEKLDLFIKDNLEEILITGGWGEAKDIGNNLAEVSEVVM